MGCSASTPASSGISPPHNPSQRNNARGCVHAKPCCLVFVDRLMPHFDVRVHVQLKSDVLDPAGLALEQAICGLNLLDPTSATLEEQSFRCGKLLTFRVHADHITIARRYAEQLCQRLLHNPVLEDYTIELFDHDAVTRSSHPPSTT